MVSILQPSISASFTLSLNTNLYIGELPITIVICNNEAFGAILAGQKRNFDGLEFGVNLVNPDFQKFAAAYGVPACLVKDVQGFKKSLNDAIASQKLSIIELTMPLCDP
jgi:thiamine pyrophosphate-dependent acetolactate synthase large subunit-like protein